MAYCFGGGGTPLRENKGDFDGALTATWLHLGIQTNNNSRSTAQ